MAARPNGTIRTKEALPIQLVTDLFETSDIAPAMRKFPSLFNSLLQSCTVLTKRHRPGPRYWMHSERVLLGLLIPGAVLTTVLLVLYAYAAWNPLSRRYLDRVSFRLLVYALVAHLIFTIVFANSTLAAHPGGRCELLRFLTNFTLIFSAGMFFCVALNLPLVLAHIVNGQRMERYYVVGTLFASLMLTITPLASGHFGYTNDITCGYIGNDLIAWVIWTQIVPMLLTSAGEVVAFLTILRYLIAYELESRHFPEPFRRTTAGMSTTTRVSTYASSSRHSPAAAGLTILKFRRIILRIGLYPTASCLLSISGAVLDFYVVKHSPGARDMRITYPFIKLADLAIYSSRPLIYGLLAATDPSFLRALHALRYPEFPSSLHAHVNADAEYLTTVIEMPELDPELSMPPAAADKFKHPYPTSSSSHPPSPLQVAAELRTEATFRLSEMDEMSSDVVCQM